MKFVAEKNIDGQNRFILEPGRFYKVIVKRDVNSFYKKGLRFFIFCTKKFISKVDGKNIQCYQIHHSKFGSMHIVLHDGSYTLLETVNYNYYKAVST